MMDAKEATEPANRSERLKTAFLSLSNESQTFMLGQAEGLRIAQTLLRGPLPAHGSPALITSKHGLNLEYQSD
jgi:hypothetical protein